jgi:hypothetical protein
MGVCYRAIMRPFSVINGKLVDVLHCELRDIYLGCENSELAESLRNEGSCREGVRGPGVLLRDGEELLKGQV